MNNIPYLATFNYKEHVFNTIVMGIKRLQEDGVKSRPISTFETLSLNNFFKNVQSLTWDIFINSIVV